MPTNVQPTAATPHTQPPYATEIIGRKPLFKTHTNIGHAKNAVKGKAPVRKEYTTKERHFEADGTWDWIVKTRIYFQNGNIDVNTFYARMFKWENNQWVNIPEFSYEPGDDPIEW